MDDPPGEDLPPISSPRTQSHRASVGAASHSTTFENHQSPRQRVPRSLPPWIDSFESENGLSTEEQLRLLNLPSRAHAAQHNYGPSDTERRVSRDGFVDIGLDPVPSHGTTSQRRRLTVQQLLRGRRGQQGRKWDHLRTAEPVIVPAHFFQNQDPALAWRSYLQSSVYGRMEGEESEVVDPEFLDELQPDFSRPFDKPLYPHEQPHAHGANDRRRRRRTFWERAWRAILRHPLVPLMFRLIVLVSSMSSLAVAARIYMHEDRQDRSSAERTQSVVAIVVDTVAVPYIGYMLWDEYTGKPLGLRAATQKIALILLDLFFIIFKSASTALAFESLVYHMDRQVAAITALSRALTSMMVVGLVAWTMNFMVNIFRTVARLGPGEG
ncbi:hypothetical protein SODALDRAFT_324106 [Sodiomyces alkalinus F11]|uniref:Regulator of phospholipase D SRF1 n=1 Tax=Sodiomyces alkalinus (strain CBS 110278 / VKM F-3762 / F11) TaxID=1314773 RepID=A0A3N2PVZ1_SODAK|nr:hypothetical protein SODALDRAFT_324106 [Sodiomyces alkalinus F11]ROT38673.1 hypothetical protein SODALDRAFT_324106 [Sodiomyces alkalinus F11]